MREVRLESQYRASIKEHQRQNEVANCNTCLGGGGGTESNNEWRKNDEE